MCQYLENNTSDLDDPETLELFLDGATHSDFLEEVTYQERHSANTAHLYTAEKLLETLNMKLKLPHSPTKKKHPPLGSAFRTPPYRSRNNPRQNPHYQHTPRGTQHNPIVLNPIATSAPPDLAQACDELDALTPPSDPEASRAFTKYAVSINKIATNRTLAYNQPCLICKTQTHDFANCPVLQNTDFLKQHYINFMQMLKKHDKARSASTDSPAPPQSARVFQIQATHPDDTVYLFPPVSPASSPTNLTDDEPTRAASAPPTSDFSMGHL